MTAFNFKLKGGSNTKRYLDAMQEAVGGASGVRVGFLENATYPAEQGQGQRHVAQVGFWNEFGAPGAKIPPRPYFRGMIGRELGDWGAKLAAYLKGADYDSKTAFEAMGTEIKEALTESISTWPGDNAPSTIAKKGFDHGLVEKGVMMRSTDYEVLKP